MFTPNKNIFENNISEIWLKFMHSQAAIFHNAVQLIEDEKNTIMQVSQTLNDLKTKFKEKIELNYFYR